MASQDETQRDVPITETVLGDTHDLDRRSVDAIVDAIYKEDLRAACAVGGELDAIARAALRLDAVLSTGGRWFNVGAGTSGRLGCLDAAELPPTFDSDPRQVIGLIAGGPEAMWHAREGAEDDGQKARSDLAAHGLGPRDAVLAISASGHTPYTLAALHFAQEVGAATLAICCDPASPLAKNAEIPIVPVVGPEVIAGSTRMKGGLVQKMVLHQLSTAVMVRQGRVRGNLMSHVRPASAKLRARAERIAALADGSAS